MRPDAASAHCDVALDGPDGERLRRGCTYDGSSAVRLLTYLVTTDRGALLRSMVRMTGPAARLRVPEAAALYEMGLVAAGPAVSVGEPLYRRWDQRAGGLTDGWRRHPFQVRVEGCRVNAVMAQALIQDLQPSAAERELLDFGLAVYMTNRLRSLETTYSAPGLVGLEDVLGAPTTLSLPSAIHVLPEHLVVLCTQALERAERRTAERARQVAEHGTTG